MASNLNINYEASDMTQEASNNSEIIYSHTQSLLKSQQESLNRLDTKMGAFLAFAGVLLRFAINLPGKEELAASPKLACNTCLLLQIIVCIAATVSAVISGLGLTAKPKGNVPGPKTLMKDDIYGLDQETLRCRIINTWAQTEEEYTSVGEQKGNLLNCSIIASCISIIAFALDVILGSLYL